MSEFKSVLPPLKIMTPEEAQIAFDQQNKIALALYASDEITKLTESIGSFTIGQKSKDSKYKKKKR